MALLLSVVLLSGCVTHTAHYKPIEDSLQSGRHDKAVDLLKKAKKDGAYSEKDRVLYALEVGLAMHYSELYQKSNESLSEADQFIDDLFTKSISNMGYSFLTNSTELPYRGEPHEKIYLNVFKAFNYAQLGKPQAVFVEVRKIDNKLSRMETEFKRMAEDYQESTLKSVDEDITKESDRGKFKAGELNFHSSALGRYLGYVMYMSERDEDDARIDLNKMREAFQNQPNIYDFEFPDVPRSVEVPPEKARVNVFALLGRGPIKKQETVRIRYKENYVKWAYPEMVKRGTNIDRVTISHDGTVMCELDKLEDINDVSKAIFEVKAPIIKTYNFIRAVTKAIATNEVRENSDTGALGVLASMAAQELTENADLRITRLLPGEVHVGHFLVPRDEDVKLTVSYYSNGTKLSERTIQRSFERGNPNFLELVNFN